MFVNVTSLSSLSLSLSFLSRTVGAYFLLLMIKRIHELDIRFVLIGKIVPLCFIMIIPIRDLNIPFNETVNVRRHVQETVGGFVA